MPIVSKPRVTELFQKKLKNYANLKRSVSRKETENFKIKLAAFQESICRLFDKPACKFKAFTAYNCPKEKKVPIQERMFLVDQRSERKMYIETIDKKVTKQMEKSFSRKLSRKIRNTHNSSQLDDTVELGLFSVSSSNDDSDEDSDWGVPSELKSQATRAKSLRNLAVTCDTTGVSDRAAAMIVTAALDDINSGCPNIIDRNKVMRERRKSTMQIAESTTKT